MDTRQIALSVAVVTIGVSGCGATPAALGSPTAQVTINGKHVAAQPVNCSQQGWNWLIATPDEDAAGFTAAIKTGEGVAAHSVQIRDLDGFTGDYWEGTVGEGRASINGETITITGTAQGAYANDVTGEATATYEIRTDC